MLINLSLNLKENHPIMKWAKEQENPYIATGHVGTHLDVYNKTKIPIDYFKNSLIVIEVFDKNVIDIDDIDIDKLKNKDFILFKTNHINKYEYGKKEYFNNHPELSDELIDYLCQLDCHFIGIDTPGVKNGERHEIVDRQFENNNIYVIENINTKEIDKYFERIYVNWNEEEKMTGYKCFLIAEK